MRRRLIKHEQTILPFVVDAQNIYPSELPMQAAPVPFTCDEILPQTGNQGETRIHLGDHSITAHYQLTAVGVDLCIDGFFYRLQTAVFKGKAGGAAASKELRSEIPGRIVKIRIAAGQVVEAGEVLIVQEAMKTEMPLKATARARVLEVLVAEGAQVEADAILVKFAPVTADGAEQ
jgi:biotin carboxyl carrier protein